MRSFDLNLLPAFDALMRHRSVTVAARELRLTQASTSNVLDRLRRALGDRILERQGNLMVPTRLALDLWPAVAEGLTQIASGLAALESFEPHLSQARFRVGMDDYALTLGGAALGATIGGEAPGVILEILPASHPPDEKALRAGFFDLFVGAVWQAAPGLAAAPLLQEDFVGLVADSHPLAGQDRPDLDAILSHPYLLVSARGDVHGNFDVAVARLDRYRHVALTVPSFEAAARITSKTRHIFLCGRNLASRFAAVHRLWCFEVPIEVPGFELRQLWNRRDTESPAHRWLRDAVARSLAPDPS